VASTNSNYHLSQSLGLGACRTDKSTITKWERKFAKQKAPLMLYTLCHQFIKLTFVGKRGEASHSEGWTAVIMDRASRFIVEQRCGKKIKDYITPHSSYAEEVG